MKIEKLYKRLKKAVKHGLQPYETVNDAGGYYNGEYPGRSIDGFVVRRAYGTGWAFREEELENGIGGNASYITAVGGVSTPRGIRSIMTKAPTLYTPDLREKSGNCSDKFPLSCPSAAG